MGMNFSPMYQPVSTKTIKADGDLNINPYDLLATDVKCDTVEATEFVGGVGNFSNTLTSVLSMPCINTGYLLQIAEPNVKSGSTSVGVYKTTNGSIANLTGADLFTYTTDRFRPSGDVPLKLKLEYTLAYANVSISLIINGVEVENIETSHNGYTKTQIFSHNGSARAYYPIS